MGKTCRAPIMLEASGKRKAATGSRFSTRTSSKPRRSRPTCRSSIGSCVLAMALCAVAVEVAVPAADFPVSGICYPVPEMSSLVTRLPRRLLAKNFAVGLAKVGLPRGSPAVAERRRVTQFFLSHREFTFSFCKCGGAAMAESPVPRRRDCETP